MNKTTIILRSAWQVMNIGDISHTPAALELLEKNMPGVEVIVWASDDLTEEAITMMRKRFNNLQVVKGSILENGKATNIELQQAIDKSVFLLHASGPLLVGHEEVKAYTKHTGKPYGVFGITYGGYNEPNWTGLTELLSQASFLYFRDSPSLEKAIKEGIKAPIMKLGPDVAFSFDIRDDLKAKRFLKENDLEENHFLCCIIRYRYTPFWRVKGTEFDESKHEINESMKEKDNEEIRQAIIEVVRKTKYKVLICPEDQTQMVLSKEMLLEKLPEDVRERVVWREKFWLTDEALSVYIRSAGLFGSEMHSPILCIGHGIPAIVCRWKEQSTKGYMWQDFGLGDWLFDLDKESDKKKIVPAVLNLAMNNKDAKNKALEAKKHVEKLQIEMIDTLQQELNKISI
ncbi:polysaccharide pyruvyl transferase family protein [Gracilibacillus kekensis]|uniref:Polysaccharide pyruvyl transferase n=1 Tax=Gracilibacillus kekensis TaxID=1027249 RepID=A0A1M7QT69_9BACI|nr:polysaccharide pyruvyl transferase family protein [Gracilibacillus kekensis]SHN34931.1 Polysaccharide pyruvyl transferase [Gracilibacillus kekensis]